MLLLETLFYVPMNLYLLWIWYITGQWDTIVNKLISIQTLCGIILTLSRAVDVHFRFGSSHSSFMLSSTYSSCWLMLYMFLAYMFQTSHLAMAMVRWVCVRYPMEFHTCFPTEATKKALYNKILLAMVFTSSVLSSLSQVCSRESEA